MYENIRRKKMWRAVTIASGVVLVAAFILVFYSISALNDCLERSLSSTSTWEGLCSIPGLQSAATFNWALAVLIVVSAAGLVRGIIVSERITKELHLEDEDEFPVEARVDDAYLPDIADIPARNKAMDKEDQ